MVPADQIPESKQEVQNQIEEVPERLCCTLTLSIFLKPVFTADGHTYEEEAIEDWFSQKDTSPKTGLPLPHKNLTPNWGKVSDVEEFLKNNPSHKSQQYVPKALAQKAEMEAEAKKAEQLLNADVEAQRRELIYYEESRKRLEPLINLAETLNGSVQRDDLIVCTTSLSNDYIAWGRQNGSIKILNENGILIKGLLGHTKAITCLLYLPNVDRLVSASEDNTVRIWNPNNCQYKLLEGHTDTVLYLNQLSFGNWENFIVSCSKDNTIRIWDPETCECKKTLFDNNNGHKERVLQAKQLSNGFLVSCSLDETLKVWYLRTSTCVRTLSGHGGAVTCFVECDANTIASGSVDNTTKIWDIQTGRCKQTLRGHTGPVTCLLLWKDKLISGSADTTVRVWNIESGDCIKELNGHKTIVSSLSLQPENGGVLSSSIDGVIKLWSDVVLGERLRMWTV